MASNAQILANQSNSQSSTGPRTEEGKQASSRNSFRHGLASARFVLKSESAEEFEALHQSLVEEHEPATITENLLVKSMAEHYWLSRRAIVLQNDAIEDPKAFAIYLRYQTANDRGFSKCLSELLKLRAEQRRAEADRQKELLNEAKIRALEAKTESLELETEIRNTMEAPLPGNMRIPFDAMKRLFGAAVEEVAAKCDEVAAQKPRSA